jgi:hypothetical protein
MTLDFSWHRSSASRRVGSLALLAAVFFLSEFGLAQPVDVATRTAARELATKGAEAFERGDYATALEHLARANTLHPAPSISVLQARALVHLGRLIEALDRYEETLRSPLPDDAPEAYRMAARDAAAESEQLKQRISHLSIQVRKAGATPAGTVVTLDGRTLPSALLDVDFPVDPGDHSIVVRALNHHPVTRRVHLAEREQVVLEITLEDLVIQPAPVLPQLAPIDAEPASTRPLWGWGFIAGGAASALAAAVTGKVALDKKAHLDSVCRPGCPGDSGDDIDTFRRMRTTSYLASGVSMALVGVGGYLLLSSRSDGLSLGVGLRGDMATLTGSF